MANRTTLSWSHDGRNTDESAFDAAQFAGWELEVNGAPNFSVPAGWETDGAYSVPLAEIDVFTKTGNYAVRMRVVNKEGRASAWSNAVSFSLDFRVPTAPSGLSVG